MTPIAPVLKSMSVVLLITHCAVIASDTPKVAVVVVALADPATIASPVRKPTPVIILISHPPFSMAAFVRRPLEMSTIS